MWVLMMRKGKLMLLSHRSFQHIAGKSPASDEDFLHLVREPSTDFLDLPPSLMQYFYRPRG
jgi:hypothetical protein